MKSSIVILPFLLIPLMGFKFQTVNQVEGVGKTRQVQLEDIDQDGWVDGVFVRTQYVKFPSNQEFQNVMFWNNLDRPQNDLSLGDFSIPESTSVVRTGDFDNNGTIDLVGLSDNGVSESYIVWNMGDRSLVREVFSSSISASDAAIGDVDNDGYLDLVFASRGGGAQGWPEIWLNNGSTFVKTNNLPKEPECEVVAPKDIELVDLDGDLDLDILVASASSMSANKAFLNDGEGFFEFAAFEAMEDKANRQCASLEALDVNQDGFADVVTIGDGPGANARYLAGVLNNLIEKDVFVTEGQVIQTSTRFADLDNNGFSDVLIAGQMYGGNLPMVLHSYHQLGLFSVDNEIINPTIVNGTQDFQLADINRDGSLDIAASVMGDVENESFVLYGDPNSIPEDTTPPFIGEVESVWKLPGQTMEVRVSAHDYKTPVAISDWAFLNNEYYATPYLVYGLCEDGDVITNPSFSLSSWMGGTLWKATIEVPDVQKFCYQFCAKDARLNEACSPVQVVFEQHYCGDGICSEDPVECPEDCPEPEGTSTGGPEETTTGTTSGTSGTTDEPFETSTGGYGSSGVMPNDTDDFEGTDSGWAEDAPDGCGCTTKESPPAFWLFLLIPAFLRRKR